MPVQRLNSIVSLALASLVLSACSSKPEIDWDTVEADIKSACMGAGTGYSKAYDEYCIPPYSASKTFNFPVHEEWYECNASKNVNIDKENLTFNYPLSLKNSVHGLVYKGSCNGSIDASGDIPKIIVSKSEMVSEKSADTPAPTPAPSPEPTQDAEPAAPSIPSPPPEPAPAPIEKTPVTNEFTRNVTCDITDAGRHYKNFCKFTPLGHGSFSLSPADGQNFVINQLSSATITVTGPDVATGSAIVGGKQVSFGKFDRPADHRSCWVAAARPFEICVK